MTSPITNHTHGDEKIIYLTASEDPHIATIFKRHALRPKVALVLPSFRSLLLAFLDTDFLEVDVGRKESNIITSMRKLPGWRGNVRTFRWMLLL